MRFLPVFMDVTSGPVALVGAGEHAVNKLRLLLAAHATVRWFPGHTDVADEIVQAAAGPGSWRSISTIRCPPISPARSRS